MILVRNETSPEDIHGMVAALGILTARGGMTSHAAVVARGMGKPCVCGAGALKIDAKLGTMSVGGRTWRAGDVITIDGGSGEVFDGRVPTLQPELTGDFGTLMGWADAVRRMRCAPMPRRRTTRARRASSAPRASASAAPSTCSSTASASSPCAR